LNYYTEKRSLCIDSHVKLRNIGEMSLLNIDGYGIVVGAVPGVASILPFM
jgi:hypothetical protein